MVISMKSTETNEYLYDNSVMESKTYFHLISFI